MTNPFDATASMLGYLYQCRLALLDALRRARADGSFTVSIETLDDVVFDTEGEAKDLLQLKHHLNKRGNLTDASSDIWKSLRIWCEGTSKGQWPEDTRFYLVTTAGTADGTIARLLELGPERDPDAAQRKLEAVARTSESDSNKIAYRRFLTLEEEQRLALVARIVIIPKAVDVFEIEQELAGELAHTVKRELRDAFVERLEGWWFRRVLTHMRRLDNDAIRSEELDATLEELRLQFRDDNLPIDPDLLSVSVDEAQFMGKVFVRQLQLIDVKSRRLLTAMREYYRASEQRSRWLREGFLLVGELNRYDHRLVEQWQERFDEMEENLGEEATEEAKVDAARVLYKWVAQEAVFPIRRSVDQEFVTRGSFQLLSDGRRVGWHPQFVERLVELLSPEAP